MLKTNRLLAVLAIAAIPVAAIAATAGAQTPYTPYTPTTPTVTPAPSPTPTPTVAPTTPPLPAAVLAAITDAVKKAVPTLKFGRVLGQGHSQLTVPVPGAGTYTVTLLYKAPGKKFKSIAKGAVTTTKPGKTASIAVKPNAFGKSLYKKLKKAKTKTIKVQVVVTYEVNGKTVSQTVTLTIKK